MITEELLAEAKRRYPDGTIFRELDYSKKKIYAVSQDSTYWTGSSHSPDNFTILAKVGNHGEYICYDGVWADILEYPNKIINQYEIY